MTRPKRGSLQPGDDTPPALPDIQTSDILDLLLDAVLLVNGDGICLSASAACESIFGYTANELVGKPLRNFVHPDDRAETARVAALVRGGEPLRHFVNRFRRKDGRVAHVMWSAQWSESKQLRLAVARDVTDLERTARRQQALYQISEATSVSDSLNSLYPQLHAIVGELLAATNFTVALYDSERQIVSFPYCVSERDVSADAQALKADTAIASVLTDGQSLLLNSDDPAQAYYQDDAKEWLGVPLKNDSEVIGAIVVKNYDGEYRYHEDDRALLGFVSTHIALAIQRKQADERLLHLAHHDPLTHLPNRALFNDRVDMALASAERQQDKVAILYLDLDHFKPVNDRYGHEIGDKLLQALAGRLMADIRGSDTIGRLGGDEFAMLFCGLHQRAHLDRILLQVHTAFEQPFVVGDHRLTMKASIGSAVYPEDGHDRESLFRHADSGMYAIKRKQRS